MYKKILLLSVMVVQSAWAVNGPTGGPYPPPSGGGGGSTTNGTLTGDVSKSDGSSSAIFTQQATNKIDAEIAAIVSVSNTLWVAPWGRAGVRGQQYSPYSNVLSVSLAMQDGDTIIFVGTNYIGTSTIGFRTGTLKGSPGSLLVQTNPMNPGTAQFFVTNNMVIDGLNFVDTVLTNSQTVFDTWSVGATNVSFANCNITGARPFYHHSSTAGVSWSFKDCTINAISPITTEVNDANYTVIDRCWIISTNGAPNGAPVNANLSTAISRGVFLARNPGRIDISNSKITYSDIGSTNPAYAFGTDIGANATAYLARTISPNSLRIVNVVADGATCTNPLSKDFLISTNNAYLLNNVTRLDGAVPTSYNPSNYLSPFNYFSVAIPASNINAASGSLIPVAVTIGASPFNFTNNTASAIECQFSGSVAYGITKYGASIYGSLAGDAYFTLPVSGYCTITYTIAPTLFTNSLSLK